MPRKRAFVKQLGAFPAMKNANSPNGLTRSRETCFRQPLSHSTEAADAQLNPQPPGYLPDTHQWACEARPRGCFPRLRVGASQSSFARHRQLPQVDHAWRSSQLGHPRSSSAGSYRNRSRSARLGRRRCWHRWNPRHTTTPPGHPRCPSQIVKPRYCRP